MSCSPVTSQLSPLNHHYFVQSILTSPSNVTNLTSIQHLIHGIIPCQFRFCPLSTFIMIYLLLHTFPSLVLYFSVSSFFCPSSVHSLVPGLPLAPQRSEFTLNPCWGQILRCQGAGAISPASLPGLPGQHQRHHSTFWILLLRAVYARIGLRVRGVRRGVGGKGWGPSPSVCMCVSTAEQG